MKKLYSVSLALIMLATVAGISSCNKEPTIIPFNIGDMVITIPVEPNSGQVKQESLTIKQSDIKAAFSNAGQDFNISKVGTMKLKKIKIEAATNAVDLGSIEGVSVFVKDASTQGDGNQVAYVTTNYGKITEATLELSGYEMKDLLSKDEFILMARIWYGKSTAEHSVKLSSGILEIEVKK